MIDYKLHWRHAALMASVLMQSAGIAAQNKPSVGGAVDSNERSVPYGIAGRAAPTASVAANLLPGRVGGFTRQAVEQISASEVQAEYENTQGERLVAFVSIDPDPKVAEEGVELCEENGIGAGVTSRTYLKTPGLHFYQAGKVVCWTRGGYFFSVEPSDGEIDAKHFNEFMNTYPY